MWTIFVFIRVTKFHTVHKVFRPYCSLCWYFFYYIRALLLHNYEYRKEMLDNLLFSHFMYVVVHLLYISIHMCCSKCIFLCDSGVRPLVSEFEELLQCFVFCCVFKRGKVLKERKVAIGWYVRWRRFKRRFTETRYLQKKCIFAIFFNKKKHLSCEGKILNILTINKNNKLSC